MKGVPIWFLGATAAVCIASWVTGNRLATGLWVVMFLYELAWLFDSWRARR